LYIVASGYEEKSEWEKAYQVYTRCAVEAKSVASNTNDPDTKKYA
jgi:hypothetical protein